MDQRVVSPGSAAARAALRALPSVSLVFPQVADLWSATTGIHMNPDKDGAQWERREMTLTT